MPTRAEDIFVHSITDQTNLSLSLRVILAIMRSVQKFRRLTQNEIKLCMTGSTARCRIFPAVTTRQQAERQETVSGL